MFNNFTRIGEDNCGLSQVNIQNANAIDYRLQNYFLKDCGMQQPISIATSQPNINYSGMGDGGSGAGAGGCVIEQSNDLMISSIQTNPKCKLSLQERPYLTIPYLGRGKSNPVLESELQQGNLFENKKSVNPSAEKCFMKYSNYPLIDPIADTVSNPNYLCESSAARGWVRGGVPSRDLTREKQYNPNNSEVQYA